MPRVAGSRPAAAHPARKPSGSRPSGPRRSSATTRHAAAASILLAGVARGDGTPGMITRSLMSAGSIPVRSSTALIAVAARSSTGTVAQAPAERADCGSASGATMAAPARGHRAYRALSSDFISLPASLRGRSSTKRTVRGALKLAIFDFTNAMISCSSSGPGTAPGGGLDEGGDRLPHLRVGHADDRDIVDRRVQREHVLGLLRVDVDPAGDDRERLAVGEEQEAVLVEVADVAERGPAGMVRVLGGGSCPGRCGR